MVAEDGWSRSFHDEERGLFAQMGIQPLRPSPRDSLGVSPNGGRSDHFGLRRIISMRHVYLFLSFLGFLLPMICFGIHFTSRGDSAWPEFFAAPFATWAISGFSWDLMITATAATFWMQHESRRLEMKGFLWHFALIFLVGICFAFPTFLYRRELRLQNKILEPNHLQKL